MLFFFMFISGVRFHDFSLSVHRFDEKENVGNVNVAKSSVLKGIRSQILEHYEDIESFIDQILPKKEPLKIVKW